MTIQTEDIIDSIRTLIEIELSDNVFVLNDGTLLKVIEVKADRRGKISFVLQVEGEGHTRELTLS